MSGLNKRNPRLQFGSIQWTRVKVRGKTHDISGPYHIEPLEDDAHYRWTLRGHWTTDDRFHKNCVTLKEAKDAARRDNDRRDQERERLEILVRERQAQRKRQ
jgi:hypothetical protein